LNSVRREIWAVDRNVAITTIGSLTDWLARFSYAEPRFGLQVAARGALWAGSADNARKAADELATLGYHGRAINASLRTIEAGLAAIASELHERDDGLVDLGRRPAAAELPPPRLLGSFEPLLLGWTSRRLLLDAHEQLITVNGLFRPFALVRGRAVATWSIRAGELDLAPFDRLSAEEAVALEADASDVTHFLEPT
jgi:hypothetical protein